MGLEAPQYGKLESEYVKVNMQYECFFLQPAKLDGWV